MSSICLSNCFFFKFQGTIMNLGNRLTVVQITVCETVIQEGSFFYLSFLIMHVGGTYFINHKTKGYFPESAGFRKMHIIIEKIIIGNTQPAHDIQGTFPEVLLKVLTSGTYRGLSGEFQVTNIKIEGFMKKLFFRSNSPCITILFLFFTGTTNIQKF